jgi:hypothetical protein
MRIKTISIKNKAENHNRYVRNTGKGKTYKIYKAHVSGGQDHDC